MSASKIIQLGGFFGRLFGPLMKVGLSLKKNLLTLFGLRLTGLPGLPELPAINAGIHKVTLGLRKTTIIISNKKMKDIKKIIKFSEDSGLLQSITKALENEKNQQVGEFLRILFGIFGAGLFAIMLAGK